MNTIKQVRKILKVIKLKVDVDYDTDFYVIIAKPRAKLYIPHNNRTAKKSTEVAELHLLRKNSIEEQLKEKNITIDYELFSLLHEIGHLHEQGYDKDTYMDAVNTLTALYDRNLINIKQFADLYGTIDSEKYATEWAINFILNDKRFKEVERLWK